VIAQPFAVIAGVVLGLIFGSFFAALMMRWPDGKSVLRGRSACDQCGRVLGPVELVPLLSALMQRGRCMSCGAWIDPVHWRIELGCAVIGGVAAFVAPLPYALGWMALGWILLALAVLDARHYWLPDALTLPLAGLGLMVAPWVTGTRLTDGLIGAAIGYGVLLLIAIAYRKLRGREGLGLGDAKLLGALGAWFGWQALPFILLAASLLGLVTALAGAVRSGGRLNAQSMLPLGTFLCVAALPGWWVSQRLLAL